MVHPFFYEMEGDYHLRNYCRMRITALPKAYKGKEKIKAILLGADPTNNGIKGKPELIQLSTVFGIGSEYEKYFFKPQLVNLNAIGFAKEELYIQNLCRNYFYEQTYANPYWLTFAQIWLKYLKEELGKLHNKKLPLLASSEIIMKALVNEVPPAKALYEEPKKYLPLKSEELDRYVYPLYRHYRYSLSKGNEIYREFLINKLHV